MVPRDPSLTPHSIFFHLSVNFYVKTRPKMTPVDPVLGGPFEVL